MLKRDSSQSSFTSFATFMGDTFLEVMTHLTRNNLFDSAENCAAIVLIDKTCLYAYVRRGGGRRMMMVRFMPIEKEILTR